MTNLPPDNRRQPYVFDQNLNQQGQHNPQSGDQNQLARIKLNAEELRVLKECNRESFWNRCLPLATVMSTATYVAVKSGRLTGSPRFGPAPKMFTAALVGFFLGKISYQRHCMEKLMELPNSPFGDMLRKKLKGRSASNTDTLSSDPGFYSSAPTGPSSSDTGDVMDTRPISTFDTESSSFVGFDKSGEPGEQLDEDELPPKSNSQLYTTSYDDLRRQNRIDYERQRHYPQQTQDLRRAAPAPPAQQYQQFPDQQLPDQQQQQFPSRDPPVQKRKNIYGDIWDDLPQK